MGFFDELFSKKQKRPSSAPTKSQGALSKGRSFSAANAKGGSAINPAKTACVFIEYQNEFCAEGGKLHPAVKGVMESTGMLLKSATLAEDLRNAGCKVFHCPIQFADNGSDNPNKRLGILAGIAKDKLFVEDTWNTKICDEMTPKEGDIMVVGKRGLDAFPGSDLEEKLLGHGIETVAVCGFLTNCCVESTMRTAYEKGFNVITITDCCATTSPEGHDAATKGTFGMFSQPMLASEFTTAVQRAACKMTITTVPTTPIEDQKPGTSGLRKKTRMFMGEHYLENFIQSTFDALVSEGVPVVGGTLVVSGDGRYHNKTAIQTIIKMAAAAGIKRVWCGTNGLLSTPATSAVIRTRGRGLEGMGPIGGFILSASHNPGGIDEDFGIKYNGETGAPAPEKVTELIFENTKSISEFKICSDLPDIDLSVPNSFNFGSMFRVEIFDSTEDHVNLLKQVFNFGAIKALFERKDFSFCYDSMHGVQGPYAKRVFVDEFGAPESSCMNCVPKEDFGGHSSPSHGHADPNLTHAVELVAKMGLDKEGKIIETSTEPPVFGAAADGDADRNMIMGRNFFCSPSDSLAVIVANATTIPYYKSGLKACARSMPTSCALDRVAEKLGIPCFEVPTGWKFFGNLMDSGTASFPDSPVYTPFICGEESFGTGGDHVREKDGMWAVLAWLQILAAKNSDNSAPIVGVAEVCKEHWATFGRNYYARYDYEGVDKKSAQDMMAAMVEAQPSLIGTEVDGMEISSADMFQYNDPVDASVSKNQGVRFKFKDGSRFVFRLSGTGVGGATIRMYLEKYVPADGDLAQHAFDVVKPIAEIALKISKLAEFTGRDTPSIIT